MVGKLSLKYIGPYLITQRVGEVAYWLELQPELSRVHNVFHVLQLRKYVEDSSNVIKANPIHLQEDLSYEEQPIRILNQREKQLHRKTMRLV